MKIDNVTKANIVITTVVIILLAIIGYKLLPELVPNTKTVHHEYTVKKSYIETDQSIFGTWREYYLVTDHGTFKVSDKDYYDSTVSGKYKFDEEVTDGKH